MMLLESIGVAIATHGRSPQRLALVVDSWRGLGVEVVVAAPAAVLERLSADEGVTRLIADTRPDHLGDAIQAAIDHVRAPWALVGADDIVPVPSTWRSASLLLVDGCIQGLELRSELGQRWADWARYDGVSVYNATPDRRSPGQFITGGAQLLSPEVRAHLSYRGRRYHDGDDIRYSWDTVAAGYDLRPAPPGGPVLLHLDRFPPHPSDPERLETPLTRGNPAPDVFAVADMIFRVRPGTWDASIVSEVLVADTYEVNFWEPRRAAPVIIDVGAHIGAFSAWLGSAFPDARVVAFEPAPENAALCRFNTWAMPNVTVVQSAVTGCDETGWIDRQAGQNTGGHVVRVGSDPPEGHLAVPCRGIVEILDALQATTVDFLKLDCEGAEWGIIQALAQMHRLRDVHHLAMELHCSDTQPSPGPMVAMLDVAFERLRVFSTPDPGLFRVIAGSPRGKPG